MERMWEVPETQPRLLEGMVHVWRLELTGEGTSRPEVEALLERSYAVLSESERRRAARIRPGMPREEFVAGRGCLRRLLAVELGVPPADLSLETGEFGKPRLREVQGLEFNVAHSQGMVLIGMSRAGVVGVDVEALNGSGHGLGDVMELAAAALHPADVARVAAAGGIDRIKVFYRCWTRREAVAKADGRGLTAPTDEWEVGSGECEVGGFFVQDLTLGPTRQAALATKRVPGHVRLLDGRMFGNICYPKRGNRG